MIRDDIVRATVETVYCLQETASKLICFEGGAWDKVPHFSKVIDYNKNVFVCYAIPFAVREVDNIIHRDAGPGAIRDLQWLKPALWCSARDL